MEESINLISSRKNNMRLYPIYRAISFDLIFLYAIKFLFLTETKGISASDFILSTSFYALLRIAFQIPITILVDKIGKKKAAICSNFLNALYVIILIFSNNLAHLVIAEFFGAICFGMKSIADQGILNASIPQTENKSEIFSKLEGKGLSNYFYLDAITSVLAGFLYAVNPYLPMILSAVIAILAAVLGFKLNDIKIDNNFEKKVSAKDRVYTYLKDLKHSFRFIFKSKRIRALLLYSGFMWGFFSLFSTYQTSILTEINISSQAIGIIFAILRIVSGIASKNQLRFHKRFKNHSLTVIAISCGICAIISGFISIFNISLALLISIIVVCFSIMRADYSMYQVLTRRYLSNFISVNTTTKVYSVDEICSNLFRFIVEFSGAWLIGITSVSYSMIIIGTLFLILVSLILKYMQPRTGLKPEEYKKSDIEYISVK